MKKIIISSLLFGLSYIGNVSALTCHQTYQGAHFNAVASEPHKVITCLYGKYSQGPSYTLKGNYVPEDGPWEGSSTPGVVGCISPQSSDCVFKLISK